MDAWALSDSDVADGPGALSDDWALTDSDVAADPAAAADLAPASPASGSRPGRRPGPGRPPELSSPVPLFPHEGSASILTMDSDSATRRKAAHAWQTARGKERAPGVLSAPPGGKPARTALPGGSAPAGGWGLLIFFSTLSLPEVR